MNIYVVNDTPKNCGVYEYGKRFSSIAVKSKKYNYSYFECDKPEDFDAVIENQKPDIIIYNHLTGTMPWANDFYINKWRQQGIIQGTIVHNVGYSQYFDFYLHQDPNYTPNSNNYNLMRPLFEYKNNQQLSEDKIKIGTFGFGFGVKNFDWICQIVNAQMNVPTELRLHLTYSFYCENSGAIQEILQRCRSIITNPHVELVTTHEYLSDKEILDFLASNHLNMFMYHYYDGYNGISSTIDFALSVKRPIAICKSNMFAHIRDTKPSICVEDSPLIDILSNGTDALQLYYNAWSHEKFIDHLDFVMECING